MSFVTVLSLVEFFDLEFDGVEASMQAVVHGDDKHE
jgi:hypothetical protein